jgi:hypothetical protein
MIICYLLKILTKNIDNAYINSRFLNSTYGRLSLISYESILVEIGVLLILKNFANPPRNVPISVDMRKLM